MQNKTKKIRDYISKGMRKLKHRKGYGVHSPFAYSIITEVIEEKLPYYAYHRMGRTYHKDAPISHKKACLLFRLANRFLCRRAVELGCDGGYSILPLLLVDSRLKANCLGTANAQQQLQQNLAWLPAYQQRLTLKQHPEDLEADQPYDFIIINDNPLINEEQLVEWVMSHSQDDTLIWVHSIQPRQPLERFWDLLCDRDDVSVTMDLYDCGLAILRPRFFKQHYIVAF